MTEPRARLPVGVIAAVGLVIGAGLGLAAFSALDHPGAISRFYHAHTDRLFLDQRQARLTARLNANIPEGGFTSCGQAHGAGFGRLARGDKAYNPRLDPDGDGVACE